MLDDLPEKRREVVFLNDGSIDVNISNLRSAKAAYHGAAVFISVITLCFLHIFVGLYKNTSLRDHSFTREYVCIFVLSVVCPELQL